MTGYKEALRSMEMRQIYSHIQIGLRLSEIEELLEKCCTYKLDGEIENFMRLYKEVCRKLEITKDLCNLRKTKDKDVEIYETKLIELLNS